MTGVSRHTVCWLIRHGQTTWNREQRYLSRADVPLTSFGVQRARSVARRLRAQPLTLLVYSDLACAWQTAQLIVEARERRVDVIADPRWRECDLGRWEGLTYAEVMARYASEARARFADPWSAAPAGGESLARMWERVLAGWHDLLREHDGGRIGVVTHATTIQLLLCHLLRIAPSAYWQLRVDAGSVSCVDLYPSAAIVRSINELPPIMNREA